MRAWGSRSTCTPTCSPPCNKTRCVPSTSSSPKDPSLPSLPPFLRQVIGDLLRLSPQPQERHLWDPELLRVRGVIQRTDPAARGSPRGRKLRPAPAEGPKPLPRAGKHREHRLAGLDRA